MGVGSELRKILSGEIFSNAKIVKRIPIMFVVFGLIIVYIWAGYNMQRLKKRENDLELSYKELHVTSVLLHKRAQDETTIENIQKLITKYKLESLNLVLEPTTPIEVKND